MLSCPIPAGVFTPVFILGAAVGRLYGAFTFDTLKVYESSTAMYAVVGA